MLGIAASYHRILFQVKFMIQTKENDKKPTFGLDLGPLGPNSGSQFVLKVFIHESELSSYAI